MNTPFNNFLPQIEQITKRCEVYIGQIRHSPEGFQYISHNDDEAIEVLVNGIALINRIVGKNSVYEEEIKGFNKSDYSSKVYALLGSLRALQIDISNGYLETLQERIQADMFSDFLEMADYLLQDGFKDPAAVMVGGVLEEHLRKLCGKNTIPIEFQTARGNLEPKKAESMNTDLAAANIYSKLDQKQVTAWLDLRNKAAHGKYSEYVQQQVVLFLQGVRDFIIRFPA